MEAVGLCNADLRARHAVITLCDAVDLEAQPAHYRDVEDTIVHEMLHIPMQAVVKAPEGEAQDIAIEQFIWQLSGALVRLARPHTAQRPHAR